MTAKVGDMKRMWTIASEKLEAAKAEEFKARVALNQAEDELLLSTTKADPVLNEWRKQLEPRMLKEQCKPGCEHKYHLEICLHLNCKFGSMPGHGPFLFGDPQSWSYGAYADGSRAPNALYFAANVEEELLPPPLLVELTQQFPVYTRFTCTHVEAMKENVRKLIEKVSDSVARRYDSSTRSSFMRSERESNLHKLVPRLSALFLEHEAEQKRENEEWKARMARYQKFNDEVDDALPKELSAERRARFWSAQRK